MLRLPQSGFCFFPYASHTLLMNDSATTSPADSANARSLDCLGMMADDLSFHEVDDIFRNVGRMIGDALQVTRGREKLQTGVHILRRLFHELAYEVDDLAVT